MPVATPPNLVQRSQLRHHHKVEESGVEVEIFDLGFESIIILSPYYLDNPQPF